MLNSDSLLIVGCGGHSSVVLDIAEAIGYREIVFADTMHSFHEKTFFGWPVINYIPIGFEGVFFIAIGDNAKRQELFEEFSQKNPLSSPLTLIHPSSVISRHVTVGVGTLIMPLCVINARSIIDNGVIVNTKSVVEHDCHLMDFSSLAPSTTLGGNVTVGERSAILMGTSVIHGVSIGSDVIVGAGSLVLQDIESNKMAFGSPTKVVRERLTGEKYL